MAPALRDMSQSDAQHCQTSSQTLLRSSAPEAPSSGPAAPPFDEEHRQLPRLACSNVAPPARVGSTSAPPEVRGRFLMSARSQIDPESLDRTCLHRLRVPPLATGRDRRR